VQIEYGDYVWVRDTASASLVRHYPRTPFWPASKALQHRAGECRRFFLLPRWGVVRPHSLTVVPSSAEWRQGELAVQGLHAHPVSNRSSLQPESVEIVAVF